jgi:hypothetical protein
MTSATGGDAPLTRIPFTPRAEASILELSKWMRISGMISMAGGVLKALITLAPRHDIGQLVSGVALFLVGFWSYRAAASFTAMATTDTADQRYLMEGLGLLRRVFLLQAVMVILTLSFIVLAAVGAAIYLAAH